MLLLQMLLLLLQLQDKNAVNKTVKTGRMRSTQHTHKHTHAQRNQRFI